MKNMTKVFAFAAVFFLMLLALPANAGEPFIKGEPLKDELFQVTVKARGSSQKEALEAALDEAIRQSVGALFAENTQASQKNGNALEEKLIQFSRGTAANYEILESSSDDSGVELTVLVSVDFSKLKENAKAVREGTAVEGMEYRETPALDHGQQALTSFLRGLKYENFLEAGLTSQQADMRKGLLNVTVFLKISRERYISQFAKPLSDIMAEIFAAPLIWKEAEEEYEKTSDRFAAFFHVLGENLSSGAWTLPRGLYETLKRDARFWEAKNGKVLTHKRIWLHFSLLDADGKEIERLPVHLKASNVIFFSEKRSEPTAPQFFMGMEAPGIKNVFTLAAAPYFGAMTNSGYEFYDSFTQSLAFKLPEDLLRRVNGVRVDMELER